MKKISIILVIVMLFSLVSCMDASDVFDGTAATDKVTDKVTDDIIKETELKETESKETEPTPTPEQHVHVYVEAVTSEGYTTFTCECGDSYVSNFVPCKSEIPLIANGVVNARIVMPDNASRFVLYARDRLQLSVKDTTGLSFLEEGSADFEIIIGNTGRAESNEVISTLGADEYAVKFMNGKIIIAASNEAFLYEAAKYFADNYFTEAKANIGDGELTLLTKDINVKREGDKSSVHYQLSRDIQFTADAVALHTIDNQKYGLTDANPRIYRRQGGCYTGENYYQVYITKNEELAVIAKKNIATGEVIYSEPRDMDHANDATYNPYTNRLYVGSGKILWIYNADTLEFIESVTYSHTTSRISYCQERHIYIFGSYYFYDDSFTYTKEYFKGSISSIIGENDLSSQGTTCDDTFIYSLVFNGSSGAYNAYSAVYDWYGNIVSFVTVEIPGKYEAENISMVDGKLYIAACSTQPVVTLYEVVWR